MFWSKLKCWQCCCDISRHNWITAQGSRQGRHFRRGPHGRAARVLGASGEDPAATSRRTLRQASLIFSISIMCCALYKHWLECPSTVWLPCHWSGLHSINSVHLTWGTPAFSDMVSIVSNRPIWQYWTKRRWLAYSRDSGTIRAPTVEQREPTVMGQSLPR